MQVKELKAELDARGVPHADTLDAPELVKRLLHARSNPPPAEIAAETDEESVEEVPCPFPPPNYCSDHRNHRCDHRNLRNLTRKPP
eukprot:4135115-Prymnesium_polylepis.2